MMRTFRLLVYFFVGLVLGATVVLAHAESVPGVSTAGGHCFTFGGSTQCRASTSEACAAMPGELSIVNPDGGAYCRRQYATNAYYGGWWYFGNYYKCPDSSYTLSGSTCSRPDCVAPETRQADGTCAATNCPSYDGESTDRPGDQPTNCSCPSGTRWMRFMGCRKSCAGSTEQSGMDIWGGTTMVYPKGSSEGCFSGCGVQPGGTSYWEYPDGSRAYSNSTYTGWACSGSGVPKPKPESPKEPDGKPSEPAPKCGAGEGVLTSSSGKVGCVPPADPNTGLPPGRTPTVTEKTKTETFSDNSTKTTTDTTVTDPGTMASHTSSTTTTTAATGGTAGQAGTPGTSTAKTESSGSGGEGDGTCDPAEKMCGSPSVGELYAKKDKTFDTVLTDFKTGMANTPVGQGMSSYFNVSIPTGSCGNLSAYVPYLNATIDLAPYMCSSQAQTIMEAASAVLQVVVAFIAFTWAFL